MRNPDMEIQDHAGILTVGEFTELTAANQENFRKRICAALDGQTTLEIDLSQTTAIDCAGLGALVAVRNFARGRNCALHLVNLTPEVQQLFGLTRAGLLLEIVNVPVASWPAFASRATFDRPARQPLAA